MPTLALAQIYPNPNQPRKQFDPGPLQELADSIKENGLIQPITVTPDGNGRFMIVAGERRFRAHQLAQLSEIEANIVDLTADQVAITAVIENLQRQDITPLEEANAYQRLLDQGYTVDELAKRLGLRQPWRITERTNLLQLLPEYQQLLKTGNLSHSQAFELSRLPRSHQPELFKMIRSGECSTYNRLRAAADGFLAALSQTEMFAAAPVSRADLDSINRIERMVEQLTKLCAAGIQDNEVVILRKINPDRASKMANELASIRNHLAIIEKALVSATAAGAARAKS